MRDRLFPLLFRMIYRHREVKRVISSSNLILRMDVLRPSVIPAKSGMVRVQREIMVTVRYQFVLITGLCIGVRGVRKSAKMKRFGRSESQCGINLQENRILMPAAFARNDIRHVFF